jgi:hypothetical protein
LVVATGDGAADVVDGRALLDGGLVVLGVVVDGGLVVLGVVVDGGFVLLGDADELCDQAVHRSLVDCMAVSSWAIVPPSCQA